MNYKVGKKNDCHKQESTFIDCLFETEAEKEKKINANSGQQNANTQVIMHT